MSREENLDREIRDHIDRETRENVDAGMSPEDARFAALRKFGGISRAKEEAREIWGWMWLERLWQDLRYGLRTLRKSPVFTLTAVLTLGLGIGANTAIFSIVNAVVLRPLPYRDPNGLVTFWGVNQGFGYSGPGSVCDPDYVEWSRQGQIFEELAAFHGKTSNLTRVAAPERLLGAAASASLIPMLGVQPMLGRVFTASEERDNVVLISHRVWNRHLAELGKPITLDGKSFTVIGVMPPGFAFPSESDFWAPLALSSDCSNAFDQVVGRLRSGMTLDRAQTEVRSVARRLDEVNHRGDGWQFSLVFLKDQVGSHIRPALIMLLSAVVLVLLIACANQASLLLARAAARAHEIAIRRALGASRARVVRQLLTESLLLAALGGALGLLLSYLVRDSLAALVPQDLAEPGLIERITSVGVDARVLGFTALLSVVTGLLFGLAPALKASKADSSPALKKSAGGGQGILVIGEFALTLMVLIGAGLVIQSFLRLMRVHPGFEPGNVLTMKLELPETKYASPPQMKIFHDAVLEKIGSIPGVNAAGSTFGLPMSDSGIRGDFSIDGSAEPVPNINVSKLVVSAGYFQAMSIPLLEGRYFSERDGANASPVAMVSENLARRFWGRGRTLGKRLEPGFSGSPWYSIVGVVRDVKANGLAKDASMTIYLPYSQAPRPFLLSFMTLVVRTSSDPLSAANAVRRAVASVDPDMPVFDVASMEQVVYRSVSAPRFNSFLLGAFGVLAFGLATVGIYGVISYSVSRRTQEIGIRMALGAERGDVVRMVVGRGFRLALAGIGIGLAGSLAATRVLVSWLFGISPTDASTFAAAAALLLCVAVLASYLPARRAASIDAMKAVRYE